MSRIGWAYPPHLYTDLFRHAARVDSRLVNPVEPAVFPQTMTPVPFVFPQPVGAVGFEQSSETPKRASVPATGGAESGALGSAARTANAELSEIATTWPTLPPEVRNMILGVIRCTFRTDQ